LEYLTELDMVCLCCCPTNSSCRCSRQVTDTVSLHHLTYSGWLLNQPTQISPGNTFRAAV